MLNPKRQEEIIMSYFIHGTAEEVATLDKASADPDVLPEVRALIIVCRNKTLHYSQRNSSAITLPTIPS